jgi:hypothetical protein
MKKDTIMNNQKSKELKFKNTYFLIGLNLVLIISLLMINWESSMTKSAKLRDAPLPFDSVICIPPTVHESNERSIEKDEAIDLFKTPIIDDDAEPTPEPKPVKRGKLFTTLKPVGKLDEVEKITPMPFPDSIYNEDPTFLLGEFDIYLKRAVQMPKAAIDYGISGLVAIEFIVESNGEVKMVKVLAPKNRQLGFGVEEACIQAILSTSNLWKPAEVNGKPVRSRFRVPIEIDNSSW